MRHGSLFTGTGMLDVGVLAALGGTLEDLAWVCDVDPGAAKMLRHRLPGVPNLGDITAVDWVQVEPVDVVTGGFPCQDVSHAGRRAGLRPGTRSGLWAAMADAIDRLRPALVIAENVRGLLSADADSDVEPCPWCVGDGEGEPPLRALGAVLGDLAELGFDAEWVGVRASDVGAPHGRFRVFVLAWLAAADARRNPGPTGRVAASSEADGWRAHGDAAGRGRALAADAERPGLRREADHARGREPDAARRAGRIQPGGCGAAHTGGTVPVIAPDTDSDGLALLGREHAERRDPDRRSGPGTAWGPYEPAIRRWERALGRVAPAPTEPGAKGGQRLSPRFVEWLMGWPAGWVTDVPGLTRNEQLKICGNGVVPQQAAHAVRLLLALAGEDLPHPVPGQAADGGDLLLGDAVRGEHSHRLVQRGTGAAVVPQGSACRLLDHRLLLPTGDVGGHLVGQLVPPGAHSAVPAIDPAAFAARSWLGREVELHAAFEARFAGMRRAGWARGLCCGQRLGVRHADQSALLVGTLSTTSRHEVGVVTEAYEVTL